MNLSIIGEDCGGRAWGRNLLTRADVLHDAAEHDQQPEKSRAEEHPGKFVAVADVHEIKNDQHCFGYRNRQGRNIVPSSAEIDECNGRGEQP